MSAAQILDFLSEHTSFAVLTHLNPDGDALGSAFALTQMLREQGSKAVTVLLDAVPPKYLFPEFTSLFVRLEDVQASEFDAAVAVDCADLQRLSAAQDLFLALPNLCIDHHGSNDHFADLNYVAESPATAQIIYELSSHFEMEPDPTVQAAVYMGIIADTGNLSYPSTTPRTFAICAQLASMGLDTSVIAERLFNCRTYAATRLIGMFVPTIRLHCDARLATGTLSLEQIDASGASVSDTEALINYVRDIDTVEMACFFRETKRDTYKLSLRSKTSRIDVAEFASAYGGGGHPRAAGCLLHGPLDELMRRILTACEEKFF